MYSTALKCVRDGMRLPLHPMLRRILRAYDLAPTQIAPNGWSQMVGGMYLWFRHSFGMEMRLHVFQTIYQPRKLLRKKGCPSSIKQWKESWFWVSGNWQRVFDDPKPDLDVPSVYGIASSLPRYELSQDVVDVLRSIYQADQKARSYGLILNRHRCLVELGMMASKVRGQRHWRLALSRILRKRKAVEDLSRAGNEEVAEASKVIEVEDTPEVEVPLSRKRKARTAETGTSQAMESAVEVDNTVCSAPPLQRTLAVNTSGEVVLEGPSKSTPTPRSGDDGPFDSKGRLRELIGAPGARIPDDAL
ncbi:Uncharacterized protein Adt_41490 [Abeliophyllum distichum]|uniref:Transposase (putative) gypsy type domain-containing protein n=1 Tax=Abeliophyllum distichum TaxID=126358 RepID=A0ABD1PRP5_9LAMI